MTRTPQANIRRHYQRFADRVVKHVADAAVLPQTIANHMLSRLDVIKVNPKLILDIGAMTGYTSRLLANRFAKAKIIALDPSQKMLQHAKRQKKWRSKQYFIAYDAHQLPIADNSVDMLFANAMQFWAADQQAIFREWQRVLRPEGVLFFSTFGPDTLKELRHSFATVDDAIHVNVFYDVHDIGDGLMQAGFSAPVLDVDNYVLRYKKVTDLLIELRHQALQNIHPERRLTLTGKQRFQSMINAYESLRCDNKIPASFEIIYGHAWGTENVTELERFAADEVSVPIQNIQRKAKTRG